MKKHSPGHSSAADLHNERVDAMIVNRVVRSVGRS
jgi:hypothetical protein